MIDVKSVTMNEITLKGDNLTKTEIYCLNTLLTCHRDGWNIRIFLAPNDALSTFINIPRKNVINVIKEVLRSANIEEEINEANLLRHITSIASEYIAKKRADVIVTDSMLKNLQDVRKLAVYALNPGGLNSVEKALLRGNLNQYDATLKTIEDAMS